MIPSILAAQSIEEMDAAISDALRASSRSAFCRR